MRKLRMDVRRPGRKTISLRPGGRLRIGRSSANDVVLADTSVAEIHATLVWDVDEDRPYVQDNGSLGGVRLGGREIDERQHIGGDCEMQIGRYLFQCDLMEEDLTASDYLLPDSSGEISLFSGGPVFRGLFKTRAELQVALRSLERGVRSGTLVINYRAENPATVSFAMGRVMGASYEGLIETQALWKILDLEIGHYALDDNVALSEGFLNLSIEEMLVGR